MKCAICGKEGADQAHAKFGIICDPCRKKQPFLCDFCSEIPTWDYPVKSFENPSAPGHISVENWAVCDVCHELVENDDYFALTKRSIDTQPSTSVLSPKQYEFVFEMIVDMHKKFKENRIGPPKRIEGGEKK